MESFTGSPPAATHSPDTRVHVVSALHTYGPRHELQEVTNTYGTGANAGNLWHKYTYDTLLRRTKAQRESPNGKSWHYGYNDRSEVTTARKTLTSDPASVTLKGWQSSYAYDAIGNRKSMVITGETARTTNYTTGTGTTGQGANTLSMERLESTHQF